jgi:hypothetical protein
MCTALSAAFCRAVLPGATDHLFCGFFTPFPPDPSVLLPILGVEIGPLLVMVRAMMAESTEEESSKEEKAYRLPVRYLLQAEDIGHEPVPEHLRDDAQNKCEEGGEEETSDRQPDDAQQAPPERSCLRAIEFRVIMHYSYLLRI